MRVSTTAAIGSGRLNVNGVLTGDIFPNAEVMLQDEGGSRQMLFTAETSGGRHVGPLRPIDDKKKPMNAICRSSTLNDQGRSV
ncbi:MAG: hypothetical protein JWN04_5307 [Myxococcaceae bacterium]|nr:hypothetical protein [Myxococcaceae bacterium]